MKTYKNCFIICITGQLDLILEKMMMTGVLYNFLFVFQGHRYSSGSEFAQQKEFETANCHSNLTSPG